MSDRPKRDACGCRSTDTRWLELCPPHLQEWRTLHEQAARDKANQRAEADAAQAIEDLL